MTGLGDASGGPTAADPRDLPHPVPVASCVTRSVIEFRTLPGGGLHRFAHASRLARSRYPPTLRSAIGLVMTAFVLAGLVQIYGGSARARYTRAVVFISEGVARWLEPVSLGIHLQATGSIVQVSSGLFRVANVTSFDTSSYFFYLPFIAILLSLSAWRFRLVSLPEIVIILGLLVAVHVTCTSLRVLYSEAERLRSPLASLVGEWEFACLQRLARVYYIYGAQLWSGMAVALVLLRTGAASHGISDARRTFVVSTTATAIGCLIFLLPALAYVSFAPPLRRITGGDVRARSAVALALATEGRHREAAEMARTTSRSPDPADVPVLLTLARLAAKDSSGEAGEAYRRVVSLDPDHGEANFYLGGLLGRQGRYEEAARRYRTVLSVDPDNPEALYQLGNCDLALGNLYSARLRYEQAVALRPASPRALAKLARIHAREGEPCTAVALYSRCLELDPDQEVAGDVRRSLQKVESRCSEGERRGD